MAESPEPVGACAVALEHGVNLFNTVYDRFDRGLVAHERATRVDGPEESADDSDDDLVIEITPADATRLAGTEGDHPE